MIAALFVQTDGVYFGLPGVDPWDEKRDARTYPGSHPVVAHPPCARWGTLAYVNRARYGTEIGSDDGCFESALRSLRAFGGVLEHPRNSVAFERFDLPTPIRGKWRKSERGEWTTEVSQRNYGHRASKWTWLLSVGPKPPDLDWSSPPPPEAWIGGDPRLQTTVERMGKRERARTPIPFRDLLITIAAGSTK
jgi:hypothetical protein